MSGPDRSRCRRRRARRRPPRVARGRRRPGIRGRIESLPRPRSARTCGRLSARPAPPAGSTVSQASIRRRTAIDDDGPIGRSAPAPRSAGNPPGEARRQPAPSQTSTVPCSYQSPRTMRVAGPVPRSNRWTPGRCVCPWIIHAAPCSESTRTTSSSVTSMMSSGLSRERVFEVARSSAASRTRSSSGRARNARWFVGFRTWRRYAWYSTSPCAKRVSVAAARPVRRQPRSTTARRRAGSRYARRMPHLPGSRGCPGADRWESRMRRSRQARLRPPGAARGCRRRRATGRTRRRGGRAVPPAVPGPERNSRKAVTAPGRWAARCTSLANRSIALPWVDAHRLRPAGVAALPRLPDHARVRRSRVPPGQAIQALETKAAASLRGRPTASPASSMPSQVTGATGMPSTIRFSIVIRSGSPAIRTGASGSAGDEDVT